MTARITPFPISKATSLEAFQKADEVADALADEIVADLIVMGDALARHCSEALAERRVRAAMSPAEHDTITKWAKIAADVERLKWSPKGSR
jgi:hypothetical protein